MTAVSLSHLQIFFVVIYQLLQMTYKCDMGHKITISHFQSINIESKTTFHIFKNVTLWQLSQCHISKYYFCSFSGVTNLTTDLQVWHVSQNNHVTLSKHQWFIQINVPFFLKIVTLWQLSQCHYSKYYFWPFSGVINALRVNVWYLSQ